MPPGPFFVLDIPNAKGNRHRIKRGPAKWQRQGIAGQKGGGRPAADLFTGQAQHARRKIQSRHLNPSAFLTIYLQNDIPGTAGHIQDSAVCGKVQGGNHFSPPGHILAKAQQPVEQIIPRGDAVEHVAHKGKLPGFH